MASSLVYSFQDQVVWVQALTGDILLYSLARLLTLSVSLHPPVLMGTGKFNPVMDKHAILDVTCY